jgi:hypothetical protein
MEVFDSFVQKIQENIIDPAITLLALAAFILFAYGVLQMIINGGDQEKRTIGRNHMIWGIIGLTIMFGAKVIVAIMKSSIGAV